MLRDRLPGIALSSDVIVGYPGETAAEFEETLSLLEAVGFDGLFSFSYSPRPGTTALRLADDVPEAEKKHRLHVVNGHQQQWQRRRNEALVGARDEVLVETLDGTAGVRPHAALPHRAPRRPRLAAGPDGARRDHALGPKLAARHAFATDLIDSQFRHSYIPGEQEESGPWKSR